jgi:hypothetical protein
MATPQKTSSNPSTGLGQNLASSGNTSGTQFAKWHTHIQTLGGMWTRRWVYDTAPTIGGAGSPSGCPTISYNYLDVYVTEHVVDKFENLAYASGLAQLQDIDYQSDSSSHASGNVGGWGISGTFWTVSAGISRNISTPTDVTGTCTKTFNVQTGKQPGAYNPDFDGSGTFNGQFLQEVIMEAANQCPTFNPNLVQI